MTVGRGNFDQVRFDEIERLRFIEKWSITKIGIFFGVSRQRIHQILGSTGNIAEKKMRQTGLSFNQDVSDAQKAIGESTNKTTQKIAKETGYAERVITAARRFIRYYPKGQTGNGMRVEDYVSSQLKERGIDNELMLHSRPFDIVLADGRTIEVKSRFTPEKRCDAKNFYFFNLARKLKKEKTKPDFFILAIVGKKTDLFIIPSSVIGNRAAVGFCFPAHKGVREDSLRKYHNRFDLLRRANRAGVTA